VSDITNRLRELAHAVADQRWSEFSMRVPADHGRDADLVLMRAADEITQTREALRRVHRWCLTAYDAGVAVGVRGWIEGGMIGKLPPMPKWILECYPEERAIDAANGGGNG